MQKRTQLALLILIGLLLFGLGAYLLLSPYLAQRAARQQPPTLPNQVTPSGSRPSGASAIAPGPSDPIVSPSSPDAGLIRAIENRARATVERMGSGSSGTGFLGYQDALLEMTPAGRAELLRQQQEMQKAHPATGAAYGISTRSVSSNVTDGKIGDSKILVSVDAIQYIDTGIPNQAQSAHGKRITITFVKQTNGSYLIDALVWSELPL